MVRDSSRICYCSRDRFLVGHPAEVRIPLHLITSPEGTWQKRMRRAFTKHKIMTTVGDSEDKGEERKVPRKRCKEMFIRICRVLKGTKNMSTPGPDGVSWRYLKVIGGMWLGKCFIEVTAQVATISERISVPQKWRGMIMVTIPKPEEDRTPVKEWRPIVFANTVGRLGEKIIVEELQTREELCHPLNFSRKKGWEE